MVNRDGGDRGEMRRGGKGKVGRGNRMGSVGGRQEER